MQEFGANQLFNQNVETRLLIIGIIFDYLISI